MGDARNTSEQSGGTILLKKFRGEAREPLVFDWDSKAHRLTPIGYRYLELGEFTQLGDIRIFKPFSLCPDYYGTYVNSFVVSDSSKDSIVRKLPSLSAPPEKAEGGTVTAPENLSGITEADLAAIVGTPVFSWPTPVASSTNNSTSPPQAEKESRAMPTQTSDSIIVTSDSDKNINRLGPILASAVSIVGVDQLVKTLTIKLAKLLMAAGKNEFADLILSAEGQTTFGVLAPATLLGFAVVAKKSDNKTVAEFAAQACPVLEGVVAAGLAGLGKLALGKLFDQESEIDELRRKIADARSDKNPNALPQPEVQKTL